jgi:hypothetical protein
MTIESPDYSFVRFTPLGAEVEAQTLPFALQGDLKFQFVLTLDTEAIADVVMTDDISLRVVDGTTSIADLSGLIANTLHNYGTGTTLYFSKYRLSDTKVLFYWSHGLPSFSAYLSIGRCFKLGFSYLNSVGDTISIISNVLKVTNDIIYTTQVTYACNENNNDFIYCVTGATVPNVVRVIFYLKKIPQLPTEESTYQKSDGSIIYLSSISKKEYTCITDYLDAATHEKLNVALCSDSCIIDGDTYSGGVVKNGAYEIDPLDITGDIEIAQAKFKVYATPYNLRNTNCNNC